MITTLRYSIGDVTAYINWLYFFHAWGFPARFAQVVYQHDCISCRQAWLARHSDSDKARAAEALNLYTDARELLRSYADVPALAVRFGLMEAVSKGDDIVVTNDKGKLFTLPMLRQQRADYLCLADFVSPTMVKGAATSAIGIFCATAGHALEEQCPPTDTYRHLLAETLADRLAEAAVERAHEHIRRRLWGYAPDEHLAISDLHAERFQGIRPAVGYPSLPDQSINFCLDELINFAAIGVTLTDNGAMQPHASVSGLMLAHPEAHYFAVGTIGTDQLADYASRRQLPVKRMRAFLAGNL